MTERVWTDRTSSWLRPCQWRLISILLGNTAQLGMGAIDPAVFAQHTDAKLRVWFSDGVNGFQQLTPDRPLLRCLMRFLKVRNGGYCLEWAAICKCFSGWQFRQVRLLSRSKKCIRHKCHHWHGRLSTEVTENEPGEDHYELQCASIGVCLRCLWIRSSAGYSLYQRGKPKELVWEKTPVGVARMPMMALRFWMIRFIL